MFCDMSPSCSRRCTFTGSGWPRRTTNAWLRSPAVLSGLAIVTVPPVESCATVWPDDGPPAAEMASSSVVGPFSG